MKYLSLLLVAVAFLLGACERHSWEDKDANGDGIIQESEKGTSRLYKGHGEEHAAEHAEHAEEGDDHAKESEESTGH
jgi:hypothetical protein